jgi:chromosome segregation ATPase
MGNEKYVNYYIELMTNTMQDAVLRNISIQTNLKISDGIINEQVKKIEELNALVENLKNETSSSQSSAEETINNLRVEINSLKGIKTDYENIKHQVNHVDTFRKELIKERQEHSRTRDDYEKKLNMLNEKIEYLQLTPAKRKKFDDEKNGSYITPNDSLSTSTITEKDGGTF